VNPVEAEIIQENRRDYWKRRCEAAEALLCKIAAANVIFPSMCANNMEAWNITEELKKYSSPFAAEEKGK
jgi:hypothetical protein